jgi:maltooligosyltrehalose trehalohydrolase
MTALLLLGPSTPLLFQGQEFASSAPFQYFADHEPELAAAVRKGRYGFLSQFLHETTPETWAQLPDPGAVETFERCRLDLSQRAAHPMAYALHRDLIRLRRTDPVFRRSHPRPVEGAVLGSGAFLLRYFDEGGRDRLLLVNLGTQLTFGPSPEPLLAPPQGRTWTPIWSSDALEYGGSGPAPVETDSGWQIPGEAAVVLAASPLTEPT